MRIVTWNMGCGPKNARFCKTHDAAWQYLLDELQPDVALVQEALIAVPESAATRGRMIAHVHEPESDAGTGVFVGQSLSSSATPQPLTSVEGAYLAGVELRSELGSIAFVSVHVYPDKHHRKYLAATREELRRALSGRNVVVGGDFNAARAFPEKYHAVFFSEMSEDGFHDCHFGLHTREQQSYWTRGAYQDDHLFVSAPWSKRVTSCSVIDNEMVRALSDHGPVMLDLDL